MNYTLREIRPEDVDRVQIPSGSEDALGTFSEARCWFLERLERPETFDGYSVELEIGELLGIGIMIFSPLDRKTGIMCVYTTDLFQKYRLTVIRSAREIIKRLVQRHGIETLGAYGDKEDGRLPRWFKTFGFEPIPTPSDFQVNNLTFYMLKCTTRKTHH